MVFPLTVKLEEEILKALENQEQAFLLNAKDASLVPYNDTVSADEDSFYSLPEWSPSDGFALMEDFVSTLHSPRAKDELQRILHSGRGVFKNFKNVLREYPEVEKLWHQFKNKRMHLYINAWYNQLREVWGLQELEQEPEESGDLLSEDFQFYEYTLNDNKELRSNFICTSDEDAQDDDLPYEINAAVLELYRHKLNEGEALDQTGLVCRSLSGDFAGCITAKPILNRTDKIVVITSFYVHLNYRGLGIGTELLTRYLDVLKDLGKEWIMLTSIVPEFIEPLLFSLGFKKSGSCFFAKIQNEN